MNEDVEINQIRNLAQELLRSRTVGSDLDVESGNVEIPIPVQTPDGYFHSWFVPVRVGNQLASFFQFLPDGTFMRFSSLQRRAGDLATCPAAEDWLDINRIQARAEVQRLPDEISSKPFLTYDRSPDRLVWAVPLTNAEGKVRLVYVIGKTAYVSPENGEYNQLNTES